MTAQGGLPGQSDIPSLNDALLRDSASPEPGSEDLANPDMQAASYSDSALAEPAEDLQDAEVPVRRRLVFTISTSFAFCFGMREGMLMLAGSQAFSAIFWCYVSAVHTNAMPIPACITFSERCTYLRWWQSLYMVADDTWPSISMLRVLSILLLLCNSILGAVAAVRSSDRCACGLVTSFGLLAVVLALDCASASPPSCTNDEVVDNASLFGARFAPSELQPLVPPPRAPRRVSRAVYGGRAH